MSFALFKNGHQISKTHSTWWPCVIEAYERGLITLARYRLNLAPWCEIKEAQEGEADHAQS